MKATSFSPKAVALLVASGLALFALSVLLHAYDDTPVSSGNRARPSSYATSAIGYAGFYDTLKRLGLPVQHSVENALAQAGRNGVLVMAEPDLGRISGAEARKLLTARRLLLILPKWHGRQDKRRPAWVESTDPAPLGTAWRTLGLVAGGGNEVFRGAWPEAWSINALGVAPSGSGIVQLIRSQGEIRPIVGNEDGILVGEIRDGDKIVWILADPDIVSNHGIGKGDNVVFGATLVDGMRRQARSSSRAPIVFDETVHGFSSAGATPVKLLFRFPFVVVTALLCCAAALLALAGTGRFGAPRIPEPPLDFGKGGLIRNGARLFDYGGHHVVVLKRYIRMTLRSAAQALHAPPNMDDGALAAWLDAIGRARGLETSCAAVMERAASFGKNSDRSLPGLFACAWDIYRWKGELLHGYSANRHHRNQHQDGSRQGHRRAG